MHQETTTLHIKKLQAAIDAFNKGEFQQAKNQLSMILDEVDESWQIADIQRKANALREEISRKESRIKSRLITSLVFLINSIVLGIILLVPVNRVFIDGEIVTDLVRIGNSEAISLGEMQVASIDLSAFGMLTIKGSSANGTKLEGEIEEDDFEHSKTNIKPPVSPPAKIHLQAISKFSNATVESDCLSIQYINIYPGSSLSIHQSVEKVIYFELKQGRMDGEILPRSKCRLTLDRIKRGNNAKWNVEINTKDNEPIIFDSQNMNMYMGVYYNESKTGNITLLNFHVTKIGFKDVEDERNVSRIISADIYFPDYDKEKIHFRRGDSLVIGMDKPVEIKQLSIGNPMKINVEGEVTTLIRNNRSLKPSILEWLFKNHQVVLLFLAFTSFSSFVWVGIERLNLLK